MHFKYKYRQPDVFRVVVSSGVIFKQLKLDPMSWMFIIISWKFYFLCTFVSIRQIIQNDLIVNYQD